MAISLCLVIIFFDTHYKMDRLSAYRSNSCRRVGTVYLTPMKKLDLTTKIIAIMATGLDSVDVLIGARIIGILPLNMRVKWNGLCGVLVLLTFACFSGMLKSRSHPYAN